MDDFEQMKMEESSEEYSGNFSSRLSMVSLKQFWRWPRFNQYVSFYVYFIVAYVMFYSLFKSPGVISFTGLLSNLCDASVALPQAIKNYQRGSVQNLR
jgi:hypothetical protein